MPADALASSSELRSATRELVTAAIETRRYLGELADLIRPTADEASLARLARTLDDLDVAIAAAQSEL